MPYTGKADDGKQVGDDLLECHEINDVLKWHGVKCIRYIDTYER